MLQERTDARIEKNSQAGVRAIFDLHGVTPQMMATDETGEIKSRVYPVVAATQRMAAENKLPYNATSAPFLAAVMEDIKKGSPKLLKNPQTGQFGFDIGEKTPLLISPSVMQTIMGGVGKGGSKGLTP
jgi:hypothetical protein